MDTAKLKIIGKKLYQTQFLKEMKRYLVYLVRCRCHEEQITGLLNFFEATPLREQLLTGTPAFVEQTTRAFFYQGSTLAERIQLVERHVEHLETHCSEEFLVRLYGQGQQVTLWQEEFQEQPLTFELWFHAGQRKEGCLSLVLKWNEEYLYQIMFWLSPSAVDAAPSLWIGALQGPQKGGEVIKALTKRFFGYRTKNLIFYGLRNVAKELGCQHIYAVSNAGYYAMNHVRLDRKLKTSFGDFWEECEGQVCSDSRFYEIPIEEYRKDMSEMKPSKRANHRRRFEAMDAITASIHASLCPYLKV
ncbi:MAG: VirK/YbjX family protein [Acidaminococcaceae bacterium]